jgi:hypothetical protein
MHSPICRGDVLYVNRNSTAHFDKLRKSGAA